MPRRNARPSGKDRHAKTRLAYAFLRKLANTQAPYSHVAMAQETGWPVSTIRTYRAKFWHEWVQRDSEGIWHVSPSFEAVKQNELIEIHHQRRDTKPTYQKKVYYRYITYEFFLPLTNERELREVLDDFFYRDTIESRLNEVGINSSPLESLDMEEIIDFIDSHFKGYSISHVSGRFREKQVITRESAGEMFTQGDYYLVDETTAIVRFIVPISTTQSVYQNDAEFRDAVVRENPEDTSAKEAGTELARVRWVFFQLFAEAVVNTVTGEDQVWLIESGPENRLYVWEKA